MLRIGWPLVLILVTLGIAGGFVASLATTKVYRAETQLYVPAAGPRIVLLPVRNTFLQQDPVQSLTSFADAPTVTGLVIRQLHLDLTQQQLADKITADAVLTERVINVHVTDHDPTAAARIDNAVAAALVSTVRDLAQGVRITVVRPASVPGTPISPNRSLDLAVGGLAGLILAFLLVVLRVRSADVKVGV
jgi:polysaccharide biosynthesis transport protein